MRSLIGNRAYWDGLVKFLIEDICDRWETANKPGGDVSYAPQYMFSISRENWHLLFSRYSRGDDIKELAQYFPPLLDAWEESERLGKDVFTPQQQYTRHAWKVNLDHYIVCFWLVGLALALELPDGPWQRLLVLIGNEGEDHLLDRIIASRQIGRKIGDTLCHPKPYQRLLKAIDAPPAQQSGLLADFVRHWYRELDRPAKPGNAPATAMYERPYWYSLGNRQLEDSGYFGRWCVEAVAAVKAFGLDDSQCLGLEYYPGDLLRPNGPSTHPARPDDSDDQTPTIPSLPSKSWWQRLLGR
ncbi:PoNe immunity protein domain-containing protein [Aquitalea sp. ASV11]|uniref:PoNe immunity protein domain-containing protein n=1 Tax=Aquitalea sp. ASV11 TaxID=2795103 RepID=UPI00351C786C